MTAADTEVRITHLDPATFRARQRDNAVAWLPMGTLEWHGHHLPLGVDGLKAERLCLQAARRLGGVVFPTMYYGDHRGLVQEALFRPGVYFVPELDRDHRPDIARALGTDAQAFSANGTREQGSEAAAQHVRLVERALWMVRAYGFSRVVSVCGHLPLLWSVERAVERFHGAQSSCQVLHGTELSLAGQPRSAGDHAGTVETSMMLALAPELVDRDRDGDVLLGVSGPHPDLATAAYGQAVVDDFLSAVSAWLPQPAAPIAWAGGDDEDGTAPTWPDPLVAPGNRTISDLYDEP